MQSDRIKIYQGDQSDEHFLEQVLKNMKSLKIVCDDGSHIPDHQIKSFETIFPYLKPGGFYCIGDLEYSYSKVYADTNINSKKNIINYFSELANYVNSDLILDNFLYNKSLYNSIKSIHFCHSLIIIEKGFESEKQIKYLKMLSAKSSLKTSKGTIEFKKNDYKLLNDYSEFNFFTEEPTTFFEQKFNKELNIEIYLPAINIKKFSLNKSSLINKRLPSSFSITCFKDNNEIFKKNYEISYEPEKIIIELDQVIQVDKIKIEIYDTFNTSKICRIERIQLFDSQYNNVLAYEKIDDNILNSFKVNISSS